ncbi:hypothetical protein D3C71_1783670 [compost metagenome]
MRHLHQLEAFTAIRGGMLRGIGEPGFAFHQVIQIIVSEHLLFDRVPFGVAGERVLLTLAPIRLKPFAWIVVEKFRELQFTLVVQRAAMEQAVVTPDLANTVFSRFELIIVAAQNAVDLLAMAIVDLLAVDTMQGFQVLGFGQFQPPIIVVLEV